MIQFFKKIDKRSRTEMTQYLRNHFRYNTGNTWNNATSYACCLKIHSLGLDSDIVDALYDFIQVSEFCDCLNECAYRFDARHNYRWQARWNGRSSGYLVLYTGEKKPSGYKSHCLSCGQLNYTSIQETGERCGCCGHEHGRVDFTTPHMNVCTYPFVGTDHDEEFSDWDMDELRNRVELVQDFDKLADEIVRTGIGLVENYKVITRPIYEQKEVLTMVQA